MVEVQSTPAQNGHPEPNTSQNGQAETKENKIENTYGDTKICFLCAKPSTGVCEVCKLVGFCGENHGKLHRPENFCFPFMVEQKEGVGRYLVATRDIEPLELVMWDSAAAMGPRMGSSAVCLNCLKAVKDDTVCGGCGWPVCGPDCEKGHAHKMECSVLAKAKTKVDFSSKTEVNDFYRCIAPLRLLKVKDKFPEVWERLSYLMDHNEERKKDAELWNSYQTHVNQFLHSCDVAYTDEDIDRAVGLLWTNCFACSQGGGQAIFPTFSFASHSCRPNCTHSVFPNKTLALQAKTNIKAGEEFTISYISTVQGLLKRRMKLRDKWFFECSCPRCSDPTELLSHASTLLCQVCKSPDALLTSRDSLDPVSPWSCSVCSHQVTAAEVNDTENRIATDMQKVENTSLVGFEEMLEAASEELHPRHYLAILLKRHLVGLYSSALDKLAPEDLERVNKYCSCIDETYQIIDPGYQRDRGTILRAMCEVKKLLAKKYVNEHKETEEQFRARVEECIGLFQEAQKCMFVRVKKDPNDVSKFALVPKKGPTQ